MKTTTNTYEIKLILDNGHTISIFKKSKPALTHVAILNTLRMEGYSYEDISTIITPSMEVYGNTLDKEFLKTNDIQIKTNDTNEIKLTIGSRGYNQNEANLIKISSFIKENFEALFEGASKLNGADIGNHELVKVGVIPSDYYAEDRIVGVVGGSDIRLTPYYGVKIVGAYHVNKRPLDLEEGDILSLVEFLNPLIESYEADVTSDVVITIRGAL